MCSQLCRDQSAGLTHNVDIKMSYRTKCLPCRVNLSNLFNLEKLLLTGLLLFMEGHVSVALFSSLINIDSQFNDLLTLSS